MKDLSPALLVAAGVVALAFASKALDIVWKVVGISAAVVFIVREFQAFQLEGGTS